MESGNLILFSSDGENQTIFKPVNNIIIVGSDKAANVCLGGLKNLAFSISIDSFCRVTIDNYTKRLHINGKRISKNRKRPLMNNSTIQLLDYKFCWTYEPKFSKSYSMSPCLKPDVNLATRNRKTMSWLPPTALNAENTVKDFTDEVIKSPEQTTVKNVAMDKEVASSKKPLIPVRENRATELRRASIMNSTLTSELSKSLHFITPKKPIPSATMVKSVNAIMRSGIDSNAVQSQIDEENISAARISHKLVETPNKCLPRIIQEMNMFNVVTDHMKKAGPSAYISATKRVGGANSPHKRTPKKLFNTPKRQSLRSELVEMGLFPKTLEQPSEVLVETDELNMEVTMDSLVVSDEDEIVVKNESVDITDDDSSLDSSFDSVITVEDESEASYNDNIASNEESSYILVNDSDIEKDQLDEVSSNLGKTADEKTEKAENQRVEFVQISSSTQGSVNRAGSLESGFESIEHSIVTSATETNYGTDTTEMDTSLDAIPTEGSNELNNSVFTDDNVCAASQRNQNEFLPNHQSIHIEEETAEAKNCNEVSPDQDGENQKVGMLRNESCHMSTSTQQSSHDRSTENDLEEHSIILLSSTSTDNRGSYNTDIEGDSKSIVENDQLIENEISSSIVALNTPKKLSCNEFQFTDKLIPIDDEPDAAVHISDTQGDEAQIQVISSISTPTKRPSLMRTRRNSRLCTLEECCIPATLVTPRKTALSINVPSSPKSIMKTPNTSKTPRKNVRIVEPVLLEEQDDDIELENVNIAEPPNVLNETFDIDTTSNEPPTLNTVLTSDPAICEQSIETVIGSKNETKFEASVRSDHETTEQVNLNYDQNVANDAQDFESQNKDHNVNDEILETINNDENKTDEAQLLASQNSDVNVDNELQCYNDNNYENYVDVQPSSSNASDEVSEQSHLKNDGVQVLESHCINFNVQDETSEDNFKNDGTVDDKVPVLHSPSNACDEFLEQLSLNNDRVQILAEKSNKLNVNDEASENDRIIDEEEIQVLTSPSNDYGESSKQSNLISDLVHIFPSQSNVQDETSENNFKNDGIVDNKVQVLLSPSNACDESSEQLSLMSDSVQILASQSNDLNVQNETSENNLKNDLIVDDAVQVLLSPCKASDEASEQLTLNNYRVQILAEKSNKLNVNDEASENDQIIDEEEIQVLTSPSNDYGESSKQSNLISDLVHIFPSQSNDINVQDETSENNFKNDGIVDNKVQVLLSPSNACDESSEQLSLMSDSVQILASQSNDLNVQNETSENNLKNDLIVDDAVQVLLSPCKASDEASEQLTLNNDRVHILTEKSNRFNVNDEISENDRIIDEVQVLTSPSNDYDKSSKQTTLMSDSVQILASQSNDLNVQNETSEDNFKNDEIVDDKVQVLLSPSNAYYESSEQLSLNNDRVQMLAEKTNKLNVNDDASENDRIIDEEEIQVLTSPSNDYAESSKQSNLMSDFVQILASQSNDLNVQNETSENNLKNDLIVDDADQVLLSPCKASDEASEQLSLNNDRIQILVEKNSDRNFNDEVAEVNLENDRIIDEEVQVLGSQADNPNVQDDISKLNKGYHVHDENLKQVELNNDQKITAVVDPVSSLNNDLIENEIPNSHDETNLTSMTSPLGIKEMLNTPNELNGGKTDVRGVKELFKTPHDSRKGLPDMKGVKELLNTPKPYQEIDFVGVGELLETPINKNQRKFGSEHVTDGLKEETKVNNDLNRNDDAENFNQTDNGQTHPKFEQKMCTEKQTLLAKKMAEKDNTSKESACVLTLNIKYNSRNSLLSGLGIALNTHGIDISEIRPHQSTTDAAIDNSKEKTQDELKNAPIENLTRAAASEAVTKEHISAKTDAYENASKNAQKSADFKETVIASNVSTSGGIKKLTNASDSQAVFREVADLSTTSTNIKESITGDTEAIGISQISHKLKVFTNQESEVESIETLQNIDEKRENSKSNKRTVKKKLSDETVVLKEDIIASHAVKSGRKDADTDSTNVKKTIDDESETIEISKINEVHESNASSNQATSRSQVSETESKETLKNIKIDDAAQKYSKANKRTVKKKLPDESVVLKEDIVASNVAKSGRKGAETDSNVKKTIDEESETIETSNEVHESNASSNQATSRSQVSETESKETLKNIEKDGPAQKYSKVNKRTAKKKLPDESIVLKEDIVASNVAKSGRKGAETDSNVKKTIDDESETIETSKINEAHESNASSNQATSRSQVSETESKETLKNIKIDDAAQKYSKANKRTVKKKLPDESVVLKEDIVASNVAKSGRKGAETDSNVKKTIDEESETIETSNEAHESNASSNQATSRSQVSETESKETLKNFVKDDLAQKKSKPKKRTVKKKLPDESVVLKEDIVAPNVARRGRKGVATDSTNIKKTIDESEAIGTSKTSEVQESNASTNRKASRRRRQLSEVEPIETLKNIEEYDAPEKPLKRIKRTVVQKMQPESVVLKEVIVTSNVLRRGRKGTETDNTNIKKSIADKFEAIGASKASKVHESNASSNKPASPSQVTKAESIEPSKNIETDDPTQKILKSNKRTAKKILPDESADPKEDFVESNVRRRGRKGIENCIPSTNVKKTIDDDLKAAGSDTSATHQSNAFTNHRASRRRRRVSDVETPTTLHNVEDDPPAPKVPRPNKRTVKTSLPVEPKGTRKGQKKVELEVVEKSSIPSTTKPTVDELSTNKKTRSRGVKRSSTVSNEPLPSKSPRNDDKEDNQLVNAPSVSRKRNLRSNK